MCKILLVVQFGAVDGKVAAAAAAPGGGGGGFVSHVKTIFIRASNAALSIYTIFIERMADNPN